MNPVPVGKALIKIGILTNCSSLLNPMLRGDFFFVFFQYSFSRVIIYFVIQCDYFDLLLDMNQNSVTRREAERNILTVIYGSDCSSTRIPNILELCGGLRV